MIIHTVTQGESIFSIAQQYGVSENIIININGLNLNETLVVGQSLLILIPNVLHQVERGDTLFSIAQNYNITVKDILRNNPNLINNPALSVGQEIVISYTDEKGKIVETNGYAYPYVEPDVLSGSLPFMTYLCPFTYGITEEGGLVALDDEGLINAANNYSVMPLMHLSTLTKDGNFSNELASVVLNSPEKRRNLIGEIKRTISEKGYGGIDIDFEFIYGADAEEYASFIAEIREALSDNLRVYSALVPKTSDGQKGNIYEGHNYQLIADASDAVLLMTYEWGYTYTH